VRNKNKKRAVIGLFDYIISSMIGKHWAPLCFRSVFAIYVRIKMSPPKTPSLYYYWGPVRPTQSNAAFHQLIGMNHTKQH